MKCFGFSDDYEIPKENMGEWQILPWTLDTVVVDLVVGAVNQLPALSSEGCADKLHVAQEAL